ncbi:hypothetical protein MJ524_18275 [Escherichia coli]|nr:hypothetical protein MJ524_18275 [Escherichia coli]
MAKGFIKLRNVFAIIFFRFHAFPVSQIEGKNQDTGDSLAQRRVSYQIKSRRDWRTGLRMDVN